MAEIDDSRQSCNILNVPQKGPMIPMNRMVAVAMLALSASILAQPSPSPKEPDFTKGSYLYRQCRNWRAKNATAAQVDEGNQCLSYIEGFVDGKGPTYKFGCFIGFSYQQMIDAYLEYMEKRPQYLQMSKRLGLDAALTFKFCRYWKEPPSNK